MRRAQPPAPLRLSGAFHGAQERPLHRGGILPAADASVHFEAALLALDREHLTRYRAWLEGLETGFGPWREVPDMHWSRLPPGRYRLHLEAQDADGATSRLAPFDFTVATPWWQRPLARIGMALALLALGLLIGRLRLRTLRRRADALEAEVGERTRELAIANARLEQAASTDPLTGLPNRRHFARIAQTLDDAARQGGTERALLVALADVDHFKQINDRLGHDGGDAVLVEVARRLRECAGSGDTVLRWGGEEFLLLFADVPRDAATAVLQRLLGALGNTPMEVAGERLVVSASMGAVLYPPEPDVPPATTLAHAIATADAALYRAKREGRDRAALWQSDAGGDPPCTVTLRQE